MAAAILAIRRRNKENKDRGSRVSRTSVGERDSTADPDAAASNERISERVRRASSSESASTKGDCCRARQLPYQDKVKAAYAHPYCQFAVAGIITLNFLTNIFEKEFDPSSLFGADNGQPDGPTRFPEFWQGCEDAFNIIFLSASAHTNAGPARALVLAAALSGSVFVRHTARTPPRPSARLTVAAPHARLSFDAYLLCQSS